MQTNFSLAQLADPGIAESERILRACVHCGFCTATCPTYLLLGDERDSPRGRIYLIKDMLESGRAADASIVPHIDRCLSCLACMTTCPSSVHYMHLVDHARAHIEATYRRPRFERALRAVLAFVLPRPGLFRLSLRAAMLLRPLLRPLMHRLDARLGAMAELAPKRLPPPSPVDRPRVFAAQGPRRQRVALLNGCAQTVLAPEINEASIRLLTRHGCEVVVARGAGCCGALGHHLGREGEARKSVKANVAAWSAEMAGGGLDAIVVNASGCGTMVKDYGYLLRDDATWAARAAKVSALARDISEVMAELGLRRPPHPERRAKRAAKGETPPSGGCSGPGELPKLKVAYHAACSLQHGQKITEQPRQLIAAAGFDLVEVPEGHICCGSAGTYNLLQPEIAKALQMRKLANIERVAPDIIAAGNIGCMVQIGQAARVPVVHTAELLDWASGGPKPRALAAARGN